MAYTTQRHFDAEDYVNTFHASGFETALMNLLAISDRGNTEIIETNWGHIIDRMARMYRDYKILKVADE